MVGRRAVVPSILVVLVALAIGLRPVESESPATDEANDNSAPGAVGAGPATTTPAQQRDQRTTVVLSGCQSDGSYEVCLSSPGLKKGPDPAVVRRFVDIFGEAGAGDSLRIAMFRWDIPATTDALVAAQRRGARVEIVADADVRTNPAGRAVIKQIESGEPGVRNVVVCRGACLPWRAPGPAPPSQDVNHLKLLLADIDGRKSVITSSSNFEGRQYVQYNSLARVFDDTFYNYGVQYFKRLKAQKWSVGGKAWTDRQRTFDGPPRAMVYPRRGDLLLQTLSSVRCVPGARTVNIMIAVVQRYDIRAQIGRLAQQGCELRIVTTRDLIENWLQKPFKLADGSTVDLPDSRVRTLVTHDKVYAIHAQVAGAVKYMVVTGTSNSTCGGLYYNDEMMLRLEGRWAFDVFSAHVRDAYRHAHQAKTTVVPVQARCG